ncbi:MAG: hypothetical protein IK144_13995 [Bacteroidaceae bacterium]|nr:hypothetical protein [Bacteroidaceae bacterium]
MKKNNKNLVKREITLDGMMSLGQLENGLRIGRFDCYDFVDMEPFTGNFKVQGMREGRLYLEEKKKRKHRSTDFRTPHAWVSLNCEDGIDRMGFFLPTEERKDFIPLLKKEMKQVIRFLEKKFNQ